jgi:hypothetical protein
MIEHREQSQISDRIIAMNKKRVAGKKLIINEHKFLISHLPPDDLQRRLDMQELRIMDQDLAVAINTLTTSEEDIIDQAMFDLESRKTIAAASVDLTITAALDRQYFVILQLQQGATMMMEVVVFFLMALMNLTIQHQHHRSSSFGT